MARYTTYKSTKKAKEETLRRRKVRAAKAGIYGKAA